MNRKRTLIFLMTSLLAVSCVSEDVHFGQQENLKDVSLLSQKSINTSEDAVAGTLVLFLDENVADALACGQMTDPLAQACEQTGATLQRTFTYSGTAL